MVKLIMGLKGSGKTKTLVDLVKKAVDEEHGNVVCIEKDKNLTYDIPYTARLIHAKDYNISTNQLLMGFISGLHAGNFDISHVFIDSFYKLVPDATVADVEDFVQWCESFGEANQMSFTVVVSEDPAKASESMKRFM